MSELVAGLVGAVIAWVLSIGTSYSVGKWRSRVRVSLRMHLEPSRGSDDGHRKVLVSLRNHGRVSVVVDSCTVHLPLDQIVPEGLASELRSLAPKRRRSLRESNWGFKQVRRLITGLRRVLFRRSRFTVRDFTREWLRYHRLDEPHGQLQLLPAGETRRVDQNESLVLQLPPIVEVPRTGSKPEMLTLTASCKIVGYRPRVWSTGISFFGIIGESFKWSIPSTTIDLQDDDLEPKGFTELMQEKLRGKG